ncbi:SusC/RagA family TonB-linked outer membrane protein, partial [Sphingobacterium faecale]
MNEVIDIERFLYGEGAWDGTINQIYPYITPTIEALLAEKNGHIDKAEMERRIAQLKTQDVRSDLNKYVYRPVQLYKGAVNFSGGAKQHNYYFSAGYDKNLGDISGHHDERISLNAKNTYRLLDNKLLFNADLAFTSNIRRTGGSPMYKVLYDKLADEQGNLLSIGGLSLRQSYIDTAGMGLLLDWNLYPLDDINRSRTSTELISYQVQPSVTYKPFQWLGVSANYQYRKNYSETNMLYNADSYEMIDLYNRFTQINYATGIATSPIPRGGKLNQTNNSLSSHYFRGSFNIDKSWDDFHSFNLVGGMELNSRSTLNRMMPIMIGYKEATETYVPFDPTQRYRQYLTGTLSNIPNLTPVNMSRLTTLNRSRLYFANASYSYDKRYTATFSVRKDEANIFGVDINQRGRPFWSAGLRWQIHEEGFYKIDWLSKLVLRATHGYTGNVSSSSAYITSKIEARPFVFTNRIYQTITNPPNPQLSWENVR